MKNDFIKQSLNYKKNKNCLHIQKNVQSRNIYMLSLVQTQIQNYNKNYTSISSYSKLIGYKVIMQN